MNITVYLGANEGNDPSLGEAVRELGRWIGESGHTLVYGGSKTGLMGEIAKSVLDAGGQAIGVEPQFFIDAGYERKTGKDFNFIYDKYTHRLSQLLDCNAQLLKPLVYLFISAVLDYMIWDEKEKSQMQLDFIYSALPEIMRAQPN